MRSRITLLLTIVLLTTVGSASAQTTVFVVINEKDAEEQQRKDSTKLKLMTDTAEAGDAAAQFRLGQLYRSGYNKDTDNLQVAGEIGILDYYSKTIREDYEKARSWLRKSAKQGYAEAESEIGYLYEKGAVGMPQNADSAFVWYAKAAENGWSAAQNNLARLYFLGLGVEQNYQLGYVWASIAVKSGSPGAQRGVDMLEEKLTEQEIAEAQKMEKKILERIAK